MAKTISVRSQVAIMRTQYTVMHLYDFNGNCNKLEKIHIYVDQKCIGAESGRDDGGGGGGNGDGYWAAAPSTI